jgi:hypothetical protein
MPATSNAQNSDPTAQTRAAAQVHEALHGAHVILEVLESLSAVQRRPLPLAERVLLASLPTAIRTLEQALTVEPLSPESIALAQQLLAAYDRRRAHLSN